MKTAVGAFALCVYVHRHRCALSIRLDRVHHVLLYMQVWRRFLLLLILVAKGFPRTSIGKGNASDRFLRFSFYYSHYKHEQSSLLKESVELFIELGDTDMAKKIDLQALHQQINELQIDKDLNRGKLHPLSEKFTIFAT